MTVANTGGVDLNSLLKGDDMGNLGGLLGGQAQIIVVVVYCLAYYLVELYFLVV